MPRTASVGRDGEHGRDAQRDATDPLGVKQGLNCYVAFHHLFPQASTSGRGREGCRRRTGYDNFIGHLENFDKRKRLAKTRCPP